MNALTRSILDFWFPEPGESVIDIRWFQCDEEFDAGIRDQFETLLPRAVKGDFESWRRSPDSWLAYILLTDQFPRNMYRGSKQAFAYDHLARGMARRGLSDGMDFELPTIRRVFCYLPFEHSESVADQNLSCALFRRLREAAPEKDAEWVRSSAEFAEQHRDIIIRFGRFAHRNVALGRTSTQAELDYLKTGKRFGQ